MALGTDRIHLASWPVSQTGELLALDCQHHSGGKNRLGRISKKGDGYLRKLRLVGASSVIRRARKGAPASASGINALLKGQPTRVVTVAMANKNTRIARAVLKRGEVYRPPVMDCDGSAAAPNYRGAQGKMMTI